MGKLIHKSRVLCLIKKFFKIVQPRSLEILFEEQKKLTDTEMDPEKRMEMLCELANEMVNIKGIARGDKESEEYRSRWAGYLASEI